MTRFKLTIVSALCIALVAAGLAARADLSINDIKPSVPAVHHPRRKPMPKPPPVPPAPTALTVSQAAGSKYMTIHAALTAIASGGTVTVEPGTYIEDFVLTRPVTISIDPDAPRGSVIIESASRPTLSMQTTTAHLTGIDFRTSTITDERAPVVVDITQGTMTMEDCEIGPADVSAVSIRGASAKPTLSNCVIHDGGHESLLVSDSATPTLIGCTISNGGHAAIGLDSDCEPAFINCTVRGGTWDGDIAHEQGIGVFTGNGAGGSFTNCVIGPAGESGLIANGGSTRFTKCTIRNCGRDGATLEKPSACAFDQCTIGACKWAGLAADGCGFVVSAAHLHGCGHAAILVLNLGGSVNISDSEFGSNADHDIAVLSGAAAVITRCRLRKSRSRHSGIFVDGSSAKVTDTDITGITRAAIESITSTLVVNGGKFHDLPNYGIICDHKALASLTKVEIASTREEAIWVGHGSDAEITGCMLHDITGDGVQFFYATGLVTDTQIKRIAGTGIAVWNGHHAITNTIIDRASTGIGLNEHGSVDLTRCVIDNWTRASIDKRDGAYTIDHCVVQRNAYSPPVLPK